MALRQGQAHPQDTQYGAQPVGRPTVQTNHAAAIIVIGALALLIAINYGLGSLIPR